VKAFYLHARYVAIAIVVASAFVASPGIAQEFAEPTYSRLRGGAGEWQARGWHGGGWGGYGFVQPFFPQPLVTGSYYQRPYPYHFDYYRYRWGGQQAQAQSRPCAEGTIDALVPAAAP
jgi:hypothetical protein